jgi:hypothetical protein
MQFAKLCRLPRMAQQVLLLRPALHPPQQTSPRQYQVSAQALLQVLLQALSRQLPRQLPPKFLRHQHQPRPRPHRLQQLTLVLLAT